MNKLNQIDDFTYKTLTYLLFEIVPAYKMVYEQDIYKDDVGENCYLFMNKFATVLANEIIKDDSSNLVKTSFEYINNLSDSNNMEVLNLLRVGILEILYTENELVRKKTIELLNEKNKILFTSLSSIYR